MKCRACGYVEADPPEYCDKCGKLLTDDGYRCPSCGDMLCPICLQHLNEYGECPACDEYEGSARG